MKLENCSIQIIILRFSVTGPAKTGQADDREESLFRTKTKTKNDFNIKIEKKYLKGFDYSQKTQYYTSKGFAN